MTESSTKIIYDIQSAFYDYTFAALVRRRIERAVSHMNLGATDLALDLGIGTGNSLNYYPNHGKIVGIDLSSGMLRECQKKIESRGRTNASIFQANALELPFGDNTFDCVFVSHVISVVSDPYAVVREAQRVAKPGARIVLLNHFQSTNRIIGTIEKWLCPLCVKIGWRSDLALADLISNTGLEVDYRFKLASIDLWETVVTNNNKSALRRLPTRAAVIDELPASGLVQPKFA